MNDDGLPRLKRPRWLRGCVLLVAIGLALVVSLCSLSGLGIRRGLIHPPWVVRRLGRPSWFGVAFATPGIGLLLRLTVTESGLARAVRELSLED